MRMRTIDQVAVYVKDVDPETALTKTAIRRMVVTGKLPSVRVGSKYLVALEILDEYLASGSMKGTAPVSEANGIRAVAV